MAAQLHQRPHYRLRKTGQRPDDTWELLGESFIPMVDKAMALLAAHVSGA